MPKIIFIDEYCWIDPRVLEALRGSELLTHRMRTAQNQLRELPQEAKPNPTPHGPRKRKDWQK